MASYWLPIDWHRSVRGVTDNHGYQWLIQAPWTRMASDQADSHSFSQCIICFLYKFRTKHIKCSVAPQRCGIEQQGEELAARPTGIFPIFPQERDIGLFSASPHQMPVRSVVQLSQKISFRVLTAATFPHHPNSPSLLLFHLKRLWNMLFFHFSLVDGSVRSGCASWGCPHFNWFLIKGISNGHTCINLHKYLCIWSQINNDFVYCMFARWAILTGPFSVILPEIVFQ